MIYIKVIELFAGIGAQAMALRNIGADYKIVGISEIDKFAVASYNAIHGETENLGDITKINEIPYCNLLTYSFPCFTKDSFVLTLKGYKAINEIQLGDYVLTHKNRYKKVKNVFSNGFHKILSIKGMCIDEIKATLNHKFLIRTREKIWNRELKKYERLFKKPEWKELKDLTKSDYLGIAINQESIIPEWNGIDFVWSDGRKTRHKNELSKFMNDKDFWWCIGRYIADGWTRTQGGIIFGIGKKKQKEFEEKISKLFNFSKVEEKTTYKYHIPLKELELFVNQFGKGAENKEITDTVINLPVNLLSCFLKGYMSGDGSFSNVSKYYKCSSISRKLILGIGQCVAKVHKRSFSIYKNFTKPLKIIEGRTVKQKNFYSLSYKLTKDKQDKAFYEDEYIWFPINSIQEVGMEEVFDIEVEDDHSFTVQNTIVHNCQSLSISGKQEGIKKGTESGLLLEVKRLLENAGKKGELPEWLLMENVKNLVSKKFMPQFQEWLNFLESIGYETKWEVLNAKDYGVPQNRERVFAVSRLGKNNFEFPRKIELKKSLKDLLETGDVPEKYYISKALFKTLTSMQDRNGYVRGKAFKGILEEKADFAYTLKASGGTRPTDNYIIQIGNIGNLEKFGGNPQAGRVYNSQGICPALSTMQGGNRQPKVVTEFPDNFSRNRYDIEVSPAIKTKDGQCLSDLIEAGYVIRKLTPLECWRVMGFSDEDFKKAREIGTSDTQLYKQAGNSIVVDVLEGIFKNIIKADKENKKAGN